MITFTDRMALQASASTFKLTEEPIRLDARVFPNL